MCTALSEIHLSLTAFATTPVFRRSCAALGFPSERDPFRRLRYNRPAFCWGPSASGWDIQPRGSRRPRNGRRGKMTDAELVVVKTYLNRIEADLAKGTLEAAGIDALVRTDDVGGMRPHFWMSGIAVLVRAEDRDRAAELLDAA